MSQDTRSYAALSSFRHSHSNYHGYHFLHRFICKTLVLSMVLNPVLPAFAADKWKSNISVEFKAGDEQEVGTLDLLLPVWQQENSLLFADLRVVDISGTGFEGNLGLGYRQIEQLSDNRADDLVWGVYGFYDRRQSTYENFFNQFTLGAELFTQNWLFRANLYRPESDGHVVATGSGVIGNAYLNGTAVVEDVVSLEASEYALPGYDLEVGRKFEISNKKEFWLTANFFNFDRDEVLEISGSKLRAEYRQYDAMNIDGSELSLGLEFRDDDVRDSETMLVARLRIPFGGSGQTQQALSEAEKRMTEYVVRDPDIVSSAQDITLPPGTKGGPEVAEGTTPVATTVTDPLSGEALNVFVVDNTGGGDCSQANPCSFAEVEANINFGAGDVVIISDNTGIVLGDLDLTVGALGTSDRLVVGGGASVSLSLSSGDALTLTNLGARPTVNGTITLADNAILSGFDIATTNTGIVANSVNNATIDDVNVNSSSAEGINITNSTGNITVNNSSATGFHINEGSATYTLTGTTLDNTGTGASVLAVNNTTGGSVTIGAGNTITGNGAGLVFSNVDGDVDISNSTLSLSNDARLSVNNGSSGSLSFGNLTFDATGWTGTGIDLSGADGAVSIGDVGISNLGGLTAVSTIGSSGAIIMNSLDITGTGAPGSKGVDITGSTGSLTVTNAGTIQNVVTGFELDSLGTGTTNSSLSFQNGTINAGVPVNTVGIAAGDYNFTGSNITKDSSLSTATGFDGDLIFVDATGGGTGTSFNRASADFAETNSSAGDIIILVEDGAGNITATNGLQLQNNQQLVGFANGNATLDFTSSNAQVSGTFQYQVTDPTGNGEATLTNAGGTEVITLADGNTVRDFNLTTTGAVDGISGSGFTDATINNIALTNIGADAFDFTSAAGTINIVDSSATNSVGTGLRINGGTATVALNNFDVSDTTTGRSIIIQGTTAGSVAFDANSSVTNSGGFGILIDNVGGDITFNGDVSVTGATTTAVQATNLNGNTVAFNNGLGTIDTSSGTALMASDGTLIVAGTTSIIASGAQGLLLSDLIIDDGSNGGLNFDTISSFGGANGILLNNVDATNGFTVTNATLGSNTTAGINLNGVTGTTTITAANIDPAGGGTAVSITGANGTINIGTGGTGLDIDGGLTGVSINQTAGTVNLGTGSLSIFSINGTSGNGVLLAGDGTVNIGTGGGIAVIGSITDPGSTAFAVTGGSVDANYAGSILLSSNVGLFSATGGHTGTLTFSGTLSNSAATTATQLNFSNADGLYNFDGAVATDTTGGTGIGLDISATSAGTIDFDNSLTFATASGNAIQMAGSGMLDLSGGSLDAVTTSGTALSMSNGSVIFSDTTSLRASSSGTGINGAGGTLVVADGAGTAEVVSTSGQGVLLSGMTVGTGGVTFDTVNSGGGANGIMLSNVDATNGFSVTSATLSGNTTTSINLDGVTGTSTITAANIDALGTGLSITGTNGTINIGGGGTGLDIDGGMTGVSINQTSGTVNLGTGVSGLFSVDGTSGVGVILAGDGTVNFGTGGGFASIAQTTDTGGTAFAVTGGSVDANYAGSISLSSNTGLLSVSGGHTGTLTFGGTLSNSAATTATQLNFSNADGLYNFDGMVATNTTAGTGIGLDISATSAGTIDFDNSLTFATASGNAIQMAGSGSLDLSGGSLDADTITGAALSMSNGTVIFSDTTSLRASSSGTGINGSGGTLVVADGAGTAEVVSTSGQGVLLSGMTVGTGGVTFDTISSGGGANGISLNNVDAMNGFTVTNVSLTNNTAAGATLGNVSGSVNLLGGNIESSTADGIVVTNDDGSDLAINFSNIVLIDNDLSVTTNNAGSEVCLTATNNIFSGASEFNLTNSTGVLRVPGAADQNAFSIANSGATVNPTGTIGFSETCTIP